LVAGTDYAVVDVEGAAGLYLVARIVRFVLVGAGGMSMSATYGEVESHLDALLLDPGVET